MLREYKKGDELLLNVNEFGTIEDVCECLESGRYKAKTLEVNGAILAIVVYLQYVKDHYGVMSLVSRDIKMNEVKALKEGIKQAAKDVGAKTFLTFCNKDGKLDRWHKFLGFKKDRNILTGRAKNTDRWILIWD